MSGHTLIFSPTHAQKRVPKQNDDTLKGLTQNFGFRESNKFGPGP